MENIRLFLIVALAFLGLMLFQAWEKDYGSPFGGGNQPTALTNPVSEAPDVPAPTIPTPVDLPNQSAAEATTAAQSASPESTQTTAVPIDVVTDLFALTISTAGGTLERSALLDYSVDLQHPDTPVELLGDQPPRIYIAQGGLAGDHELPTHHALYTTTATDYRLADGQDELIVPLQWRSADGVIVEKRFHFHRGSYVIDVEYQVINNTAEVLRVHQYEQLKRNEESSRQGMVYTYTGAVLSTPEKRFKKHDVDDLRDAPIDIEAKHSWIGIMQHYFVSALIPPSEDATNFYSKVLDNDVYLVGFVSPAEDIAPSANTTLNSRIYIGPKRHDIVASVTPGLELTVDFGVLWFIAKPLFQVLTFIHDILGNWGWGIVILTFLLKLMFYPLSAAGYRSMANMRRVQPRMLALRDRYADDRTQLNQAMMQLYKEEKINPLGGCLPIVIQIPVFISLYWVLLESVELRQAPFILWIHDLSTRDPYFVLPLLMGISMWGQQKLNPAPLDPTQAKVMQILPFVFTVFFAFFPSGLVLYWLVNNILSIAQQWKITRSIEKGEA